MKTLTPIDQITNINYAPISFLTNEQKTTKIIGKIFEFSYFSQELFPKLTYIKITGFPFNFNKKQILHFIENFMLERPNNMFIVKDTKKRFFGAIVLLFSSEKLDNILEYFNENKHKYEHIINIKICLEQKQYSNVEHS